MYIFFSTFVLTLSLSVLLLLVGKIFSMKNLFDRELQSPFECGFSTTSESRMPFSIHFFMVALIFVLFDVELVILFPLMMELMYLHSTIVQVVFLFFLLVLTLGLFNEWNQMVLEWSKFL